jgi:uncharacterized protein (TIGR02646 family)
LCDLYDGAPDRYQNGAEKFDFDSDLYGHPAVREALTQLQSGKCAFCESKITHVAPGDIEHYRPKAGVKQQESDPLGRPGYYWLAYEWSNLFLCCPLCNQSFKRNLFPLANPGRRARTHHDELSREQPLLINPATTDPGKHIEFQREVAVPVHRSRKGQATIDVAGLNREELREMRFKRLEEIEAFLNVRRLLTALLARPDPPPETAQTSAEVSRILEEACREDAPFSAMVRALCR